MGIPKLGRGIPMVSGSSLTCGRAYGPAIELASNPAAGGWELPYNFSSFLWGPAGIRVTDSMACDVLVAGAVRRYRFLMVAHGSCPVSRVALEILPLA